MEGKMQHSDGESVLPIREDIAVAKHRKSNGFDCNLCKTMIKPECPRSIHFKNNKISQDTTWQISQKFHIELGAGLGPLAGRVWRVGLMGHTARPENVERLLGALAETL